MDCSIGKFLESGVSGHSISKHLQKVYLFKVNDGRPELVDVNSSGRTRPLDGGCVPNVIVSPSTFPTADRRNLGSVLINLN